MSSQPDMHGDDVSLASGAGIDVDHVQIGGGTAIRISAIPGDGNGAVDRSPRHLVFSGDPCVAVSSIPHVRIGAGGVELADPEYGLVVLSSTCKPCCQCDDYYDASMAVKGVWNRLDEVRKRLDKLGEKYDKAVDDYNDATDKQRDGIDTFSNVAVRVSKMRGKTVARTATGYWSIGIVIENRTTKYLTVSSMAVYGFQPRRREGDLFYEKVSEAWSSPNLLKNSSGKLVSSGTSIPTSFALNPGRGFAYSILVTRRGDDRTPKLRCKMDMSLSNGLKKSLDGAI